MDQVLVVTDLGHVPWHWIGRQNWATQVRVPQVIRAQCLLLCFTVRREGLGFLCNKISTSSQDQNTPIMLESLEHIHYNMFSWKDYKGPLIRNHLTLLVLPHGWDFLYSGGFTCPIASYEKPFESFLFQNRERKGGCCILEFAAAVSSWL